MIAFTSAQVYPPPVHKPEQIPHLFYREAEFAASADEVKPPEEIFIVEPVTAFGARR